MKKKTKWSIYQALSFFILILAFLLLNKWGNQIIMQTLNVTSMYILGVLIFLFVSWIYTMIYFQQQKYPRLLEHKNWRYLPIFVTVISLLSLVGFIILVTIGPLLEWVEQSNWVIYIIFGYFIILYYFFIMSLVYKFSDNRNQVVHQTYIWALGLLIVIAFLFGI